MQIVPQPFSFASVLCCSSGTDGGFITTLIGFLSSTVYLHLFHVLHCLQPVTLARLLLLLHPIVSEEPPLRNHACRMLPCPHPLSPLSLNKKQAKWRFTKRLIRRVHQPQPPTYCWLAGHKVFVVRELWSHCALMVTHVTLVTKLLWSFLHGCWWWISGR